MLQIELYVFIRSLPDFSSNIFEELERIEPYVEILEVGPESDLKDKPGWFLIYRGSIGTKQGRLGSGDMFYLGVRQKAEVIESGTVIYFSEDALEKFLRNEPELALPVAEKMKVLMEGADTV